MEDAPYRGRASRIDKWKELVKQATKDLQLEVAAPNKLQILDYPMHSKNFKDMFRFSFCKAIAVY